MAKEKVDPKIIRAWNDFNKQSIKKIPSSDVFQKLVSLSPKVRAWYADWSFSNAAFSQMPESFKAAGMTPKEWEMLSEKLPEINKVRKESSARIEEKAKVFSKFVSAEEELVKEKLRTLENDHVKILKVNVTCLALEDQLEILACPEDSRNDLEKTKLEALRVKLLKDLKEGSFKDPFVFGDFKDLLI